MVHLKVTKFSNTLNLAIGIYYSISQELFCVEQKCLDIIVVHEITIKFTLWSNNNLSSFTKGSFFLIPYNNNFFFEGEGWLVN